MTVASTALSTSYAALLAELGDLTKSMCADQPGGPEKVEAAAEEAGAELPDDAKKPGAEQQEDTTQEQDDMTKSFSVTMPDGTVQEVIDGGDLLKSMSADIDTLKGSLADVTAQLAAVSAERDAALQLSTGLLSAVKTQGDMLKSLSADVAKIGNQSVGRRATLAVTEVAPAAVDAAPNKIGTEEFFAKAMTLIGQDGITARTIAEAEARISRGLPPQPALAAAVAAIA